MGFDARNPRRWSAGEALVTVTTAVAAKGPRGLKPTSFVCNGYLSCSSNLHTHTHTYTVVICPGLLFMLAETLPLLLEFLQLPQCFFLFLGKLVMEEKVSLHCFSRLRISSSSWCLARGFLPLPVESELIFFQRHRQSEGPDVWVIHFLSAVSLRILKSARTEFQPIPIQFKTCNL